MPFAAHGLLPAFESFGMQQLPGTPSRRSGAPPRIVLGKPSIDVERPPDIRDRAPWSKRAENIDKGHEEKTRRFVMAERVLAMTNPCAG